MPEEKTNQDIWEVLSFLKDNSVAKSEFDGFRSEFNELKKEVTAIRATMVTKDYLDDKLADLRGDLVVLLRKEDTKFKTLLEILLGKKIISQPEAERILKMEPFPQLAL
jgi:hypothetical protein